MEITIKVTGLDELSNAILGLCGLIISQNNKGVEMEKRSVPTSPTKEELEKLVEGKVDITPKAETKVEPVQEAVPTENPAYTFEQIQVACANLAREGKRAELGKLIGDFGLTSLVDLKDDQYNSFALKLREIGGTI
ncbi:hypothetical protein [Peptoniphilus sp.]|uniref:hypothetical protein n=1 Tax=Peptoniphilus sp. TaxID=1971214 RepID=UPI003995D996